METKPWERYFDLPSIFPVERSNTTTIAVDEALKTFWQKRGREVFDRWFYLKLEGASDKYGSLDQIAGPLELVLASLMVADKGVSDQHLSPIAYLCAPRHPVATFKYYFQRAVLKSKPQGDLAKFGVKTIAQLRTVCSKAIDFAESGSPTPSQPYDFVDLVFTGARGPGRQCGAVRGGLQGRCVGADGGQVELRAAL
ncbi:hypothetical protein Ae201684P_019685 [Aphanomyces euteiches]|uniref:Uncharacterized protein n=1 Tax=Aphanomyces euteiches TaxID=100861 RepID=A0A6G0XED6_9STRA|nr:hypothetical protein Ae201684_005639 [Aphanomyces euteiches]KAH9078605.1 hypothetical protein Ae201684P_019685 [Aphanomyces euteiches]KAH9142899.1 hypothetical protein AeRB84_013063 [Aphanomyces euteiches]